MISEQIKTLLSAAEAYEQMGCDLCTQRLLREAADTIEALSEKVRANNLHEGWVSVSERLPEEFDDESENVLITVLDKSGEGCPLQVMMGYTMGGAWYWEGDHPCSDNYPVIAWKPLPAPYWEVNDNEE